MTIFSYFLYINQVVIALFYVVRFLLTKDPVIVCAMFILIYELLFLNYIYIYIYIILILIISCLPVLTFIYYIIVIFSLPQRRQQVELGN